MTRSSHKEFLEEIEATEKIESGRYNIVIDGSLYKAYDKKRDVVSSSSDLTTVWDAVTTDIGSNPAVIEFGVGTFDVDTTLAFTNSNISIVGKGVGLTTIRGSSSLPDASSILESIQTQSATAHAIDAVAEGDGTITTSTAADASNYVQGDMVLIYNNEDISNETAGDKKAQLMRVSVDGNPSTGVIDVYGQADEALGGGTSPQIVKITFVSNITVKGITFTNAKTSVSSAPSGAVKFKYCRNVCFDNCEFVDCIETSLRLHQCDKVLVTRCLFDGIVDTPITTEYQIAHIGGNDVHVDNCIFEGRGVVRHAFTNGSQQEDIYSYGYARNSRVTNCTCRDNVTTGMLDTHAGSKFTYFANNTIVDASIGIQLRGYYAIVKGNIIHNCTSDAVLTASNADETIVDGNRIDGCTTGVNMGSGLDWSLITNNVFKGCTTADIDNNSNANVLIADNHHRDPTTDITNIGVNGKNVMAYTDNDGQYWIRHDDDNQWSGLKVGNSDGSTQITNGVSATGEYQPTIIMLPLGTGRTAQVQPRIASGNDDSNVTPIHRINVMRTDFTAITTRPVLHAIQNDGTDIFDVKTNGDVEVYTDGQGLILSAPNGNRHRVTVDNSGVLQVSGAL